MTRKRCVKLLMSYGCSRNEANKKANEFRRVFHFRASSPYDLLCECEIHLIDEETAGLLGIINEIEGISDIVIDSCQRFVEAVDNVTERLGKWRTTYSV